MDKKILDTYYEWLNSSELSLEEKAELESIKDNEKEIEERFFQDLEFGTGGLRGVMSLGTNRMNRFMIRKATQGLANYVVKNFKEPVVAIGFDSRNHSSEYAEVAANVLASNGIHVFLYKELMPTPALSYAVRYLHASAGIVVTASHNPKIYNGYKVYGPDGCQCTNEYADAVLNEIKSLDTFKDIKFGDFQALLEENKIEYIKEELIESYFSSTLKQSVYNEEKTLNVVYTPLNGAGRRCVTEVLKRDGFTNVKVVKEQENPDGNFPTCPFPNPELMDALKLGTKLLLDNKYDILIATDPDSDRIGVVVNQNGTPVNFTGNEIGVLLFDAIYNGKKLSNSLPKSPTLVKTIVSTDLVNVMAKKWGVKVIEVLTGFKYIGEQILFLEQKDSLEDYLLGFEESCGYLSNTDIRDKDAVNASLLVCELANHYKKLGMTLKDRINQLYDTFGDFKTKLLTYEFQGLEGMKMIKSIMAKFRDASIKESIPGIDHIGDYKSGEIIFKDYVEKTNLPSSDVVKFFLDNDETITVRPSGTEPKLKVYLLANGQERLEKLNNIISSIIK